MVDDRYATSKFEIGTAYLDSMKIAFQQQITGEFMREHFRLNVEDDPFTGGIIRRFTTYVRTHNLPSEHVEEVVQLGSHVPTSWWQHWKQDVAAKRSMLRWIVRRWPVKTRTQCHIATVTLDLRRFRVYPDAPNIGDLHGFALNYMNHTKDTSVKWITGESDD